MRQISSIALPRRLSAGWIAALVTAGTLWPAFAHCCCFDSEDAGAAATAMAPSCHAEPATSESKTSMEDAACICATDDPATANAPKYVAPERVSKEIHGPARTTAELETPAARPFAVARHQDHGRASPGTLHLLHCSFLI